MKKWRNNKIIEKRQKTTFQTRAHDGRGEEQETIDKQAKIKQQTNH